ncbi:hypothetical protein V6259_19110 [Marinomonas sp. TI.3.20]|uniref:hypothetical protein n=1 Tax=Marinomonas sp. TI.3.20 TaxID=3121296 RepID=UPI00311DE0AF
MTGQGQGQDQVQGQERHVNHRCLVCLVLLVQWSSALRLTYKVTGQEPGQVQGHLVASSFMGWST